MIFPRPFYDSSGRHLAYRRNAMAKARFSVLFALMANTASTSAQIGLPILGIENSTVSSKAVAFSDTSGLNRVSVRCWLGQQLVILLKDNADKDQGYQEI